MAVHTDAVFATVDPDNDLVRIAGGNETEVYRTDDGRFVIKLKSELGGDPAEALAEARRMRAAAERYADCLGPEHTIPSFYVVARDGEGRAQVLVVQPLVDGRPLFDIDYGALDADDRHLIAYELRRIIARSLRFYRRTGSMPDLYGRTSTSKAERLRLNRPWMLPYRLWGFLVRRNLLRAHNLMLTGGPRPRVVLVDYDFVRRGPLYRALYFLIRWFLFWRDQALIGVMRRSGQVPKA